MLPSETSIYPERRSVRRCVSDLIGGLFHPTEIGHRSLWIPPGLTEKNQTDNGTDFSKMS